MVRITACVYTITIKVIFRNYEKLSSTKGMKTMIKTIIVSKDEDVKACVISFMRESGWKKAYISGAIGSIYNAVFAAPSSPQYPPVTSQTQVYMPSEILSFTGEVMDKSEMPEELKSVYKDDGSEYFVHIHASTAVSGAHVYGGGLHAAQAFRSLKIYIQEEK